MNPDLHEDPQKRDPESKFVQLLWEKGNAVEKEVIENLQIPFEDLSSLADEEKERRTLQAMEGRAHLIYGGRIRNTNLLGEPDILRWDRLGYIAGDIKSGVGEEEDEDTGTDKPKKHYAVHLALLYPYP